jgi:hypothetical protein
MLSVAQNPKSRLDLIPAAPVVPQSVMVKVIYNHIDENKKSSRAFVNMRVETDVPEQNLLERWIRSVLHDGNHQEPWPKFARKMSKNATEYKWFTNERNSLVKPWYDQERIIFSDH